MKILAIKTDSMTAEISLHDDNACIDNKVWEAGRALSKDLLGVIDTFITQHSCAWTDIEGVVVFRGPGSFTSLRIGITTTNTIAYAQNIPVVGSLGDSWLQVGLQRLISGDNDQIVLPEYGADPHITVQKK